jgi:hypothetical protein
MIPVFILGVAVGMRLMYISPICDKIHGVVMKVSAFRPKTKNGGGSRRE